MRRPNLEWKLTHKTYQCLQVYIHRLFLCCYLARQLYQLVSNTIHYISRTIMKTIIFIYIPLQYIHCYSFISFFVISCDQLSQKIHLNFWHISQIAIVLATHCVILITTNPITIVVEQPTLIIDLNQSSSYTFI